MPLERFTYQTLLACLRDMDIWLKEFGFAKPDRFRQALANLEYVDRKRGGAPVVELPNSPKQDDLVWSLVEATAFGDIFPGIKIWAAQSPEILRQKLQAVLTGPLLPKDESPTSNVARNTMFELELGSRLLRMGGDVRIDGPSDLIVRNTSQMT